MSDRDTLFRTLEFQRTKGAEDRVTVESLTLGHFLDKADVLKQNEAALKNLAAQARGEVTIREALQEINVWGAETAWRLRTNTIRSWGDGCRVTPSCRRRALASPRFGARQNPLPKRNVSMS